MSPRAQRALPLHIQISDHYKKLILDGDLEPGDQLPSIRDTARDWGVGFQAAQRAYELLASARLVRTSPQGTFAAERRAAAGPQQWAQATRYPGAERIEVRAAELIPAAGQYAYVRPILGLGPSVSHVIRREQLTWGADGDPYMLAVTWCHPRYAEAVPELLAPVPLPDPRGAAHLIAGRTGQQLTWGRSSREARPARDDGREIPLLGRSHVLAEVWKWGAGEQVLEYGEMVLPENRVIETDLEP